MHKTVVIAKSLMMTAITVLLSRCNSAVRRRPLLMYALTKMHIGKQLKQAL